MVLALWLTALLTGGACLLVAEREDSVLSHIGLFILFPAVAIPLLLFGL